MQNPEVWSFNEPQSTFTVEKLDSFNYGKSFDRFYFNHLVSVVIPDCLRIPDNITNVLTDDCSYYKVSNLNLSQLLDPKFLNSFIKQGKLLLLNIDKKIDCDNCCAVQGGTLILSLKRDTYLGVGLEGTKSHFTRVNADRFVIKLDLTNPKLIPGKPLYEKTKAALNRLETFTAILTWHHTDITICPSSIAKYFQEENYTVKLCEPNFDTHLVYSIKSPTLDDVTIVDFAEWLGMVSIDAFDQESSDYVSSYEVPEPSVDVGPIRVLSWRGLFASDKVHNVVEFLRHYNQAEDKMWVTVYVQGFSDAPMVEPKVEQNFYTSGDNSNLLILKGAQGWLCKHRCSAKKYK